MQNLTFVPRERRESHLFSKCNTVPLHIAHSANVLLQPPFNQSYLSCELDQNSIAMYELWGTGCWARGVEQQNAPEYRGSCSGFRACQAHQSPYFSNIRRDMPQT